MKAWRHLEAAADNHVASATRALRGSEVEILKKSALLVLVIALRASTSAVGREHAVIWSAESRPRTKPVVIVQRRGRRRAGGGRTISGERVKHQDKA